MGTDLITATKTGDRLKTLLALRDLLAERLQTTNSSRDIASMSRRLMQVIAEIEDITASKEIEEHSVIREMQKNINLMRIKK